MFSYQLVQGECHASTMSLERRAFYIAFGLCWTVCTFVGGYFVAREPLNEVLLLTLIIAFATGLVHRVCSWLSKNL